MNFPKQPKTLFNRTALAALLATSLLAAALPAQADSRLENMENRLYEMENKYDALWGNAQRVNSQSKEYDAIVVEMKGLDVRMDRLRDEIRDYKRENKQ